MLKHIQMEQQTIISIDQNKVTYQLLIICDNQYYLLSYHNIFIFQLSYFLIYYATLSTLLIYIVQSTSNNFI